MMSLRGSRSAIQALLGAVILTTGMLPLGGCIFETPPKVSVTGLQVRDVGVSEEPSAKLGVGLRLENPTEKPIQLEVYQYTVVVDSDGDRNRWSGTWSALRTLPAGETVQMSIPAIVPYNFAKAPEKAEWRVSGTISYKAPGRLAQILFDTGFRRPEHQFNGRGISIAPPAEVSAGN